YYGWASDEFLVTHDHFQLLGEDNFRRYLPVELVRVRVHADDTPLELLLRVAAARAAGSRVTISSFPDLPSGELEDLIGQLDERTESWGAAIEFVEESDEHLAKRLAERTTGR